MILASIVRMLLEARKFAFPSEGEDAEAVYYSGFSGGDNSPVCGLTTLFFGDARETGFIAY